MSLGYLSALALARQDWPSALAYVRRATSILIKLGERETAGRPSVARGESQRIVTFSACTCWRRIVAPTKLTCARKASRWPSGPNARQRFRPCRKWRRGRLQRFCLLS